MLLPSRTWLLFIIWYLPEKTSTTYLKDTQNETLLLKKNSNIQGKHKYTIFQSLMYQSQFFLKLLMILIGF